jgi:hypothetical protein
MDVDPRIRATLERFLREATERNWQLGPEAWSKIDRRLEEVRRGIDDHDEAAVREAVKALDGMRPRRLTVVRATGTAGMPAEVRERHDALVQQLGRPASDEGPAAGPDAGPEEPPGG